MPAKSSLETDTKPNQRELINLNSNQGVRIFPNRFALFFLLMTVGLTMDLYTKSYTFQHFFDPQTAAQHLPQEVHWWVEGVFGIQTSTNPGALFGIGKGLSWLFAGLSFIALGGIVLWLFVWRAAVDRWLTVALGLISGGILGNLYDRLGFGFTEGFPEEIRTNVRDWILFRLEGIPMFDPWPNFNIADSLLVCGAAMLFIHAIFWTEPNSSPSSEPESKNGD